MPNATDIKINHKFKFALITFGSHNAAQVSIRELKKNAIFSRVQWARGDNDLPEEYFQAVQDLYVGHLPPGCSLNQLRSALCHIINPEIVIRIHRSGCYGFIYFNSHTEAEAALLCLRGKKGFILKSFLKKLCVFSIQYHHRRTGHYFQLAQRRILQEVNTHFYHFFPYIFF